MENEQYIRLPRVVVTGMGALTSLGENIQETWQNIRAGKSGVTRLTPEDRETRLIPEHLKVSVAAIMREFDPRNYMEGSIARNESRAVQYAVAAGQQALVDAGLYNNGSLVNVDSEEIGTIWGSGMGGALESASILQILANQRLPFPRHTLSTDPSRITYVPGIRFKINGPSFGIGAACASGLMSLATSLDKIHLGHAKVMLTGGAEDIVTGIAISGYEGMRALSINDGDPTQISRPFDKKATGFVMAAGAGAIVLEELEHARKRGANIYAEFVGYGQTSDGYSDTHPNPKGEQLLRAMSLGWKAAGIDYPDYISAHATSTKIGDAADIVAIIRALGKNTQLATVSARKSQLGHGIGAAGLWTAQDAILAVRDNIVPGTLNLEDCILNYFHELGFEECEVRDISLKQFLPRTTRHQVINYATANASGFGGGNCSVTFKKYNPAA